MSRSVDILQQQQQQQQHQQSGQSSLKRQKRYIEYRQVDQSNESTQTGAEILLSTRPTGALFNSTYVIEPVAFIQNLASSIMGKDQFLMA